MLRTDPTRSSVSPRRAQRPPRSGLARRWAAAGALALVMSPGQAFGQATGATVDTTVAAADPGDVRGQARAAQARFEIRRARLLPRTLGGSGGPCDEVVGRMCLWHGTGGDWAPEPEDPEIGERRADLLATLDSLQTLAPADAWVLGQRIWYRAEQEGWPAALRLARACGPPQERWWCAALEGLTLHQTGRYREAERAFDLALYEMDLERAWAWRVPVRAVDGDGRELLEALRTASVDSVELVLERMWGLADPLHLVEGNDRKTAHFARWVVATFRDGARTPYGIRWGSDLEELLVRNGWAMGYEREPDRFRPGEGWIVGHDHPEGREYLPPGAVLASPAHAAPEDLLADRLRPRSLYAPAYAPLILPMERPVARFPRGDSVVVVATPYLPEDTTRHARIGHERPWMSPGDQEGLPDQVGLFLLDAGTGRAVARATAQGREGGLTIRAGPGRYVIVAESWSPSERRAGRWHMGFEHRPVPEDLPVLSDLLLVEAGGDAPEDLSEAAGRALPRARITLGDSLGIVWEVSGLGFRPGEPLGFELSVERTDRNVLQRLGGFLGLTDPPRPLVLAWSEAGPAQPGPLLRHVDLDIPGLEEGSYRIRLVLSTEGRDEVVVTRTFEVGAGDPP